MMDIFVLVVFAVVLLTLATFSMWANEKKNKQEELPPAPEPVFENAYKIISNYAGTFNVTKEVLRDGVLMPVIQPYRKVFPTREEAEQFIIAEEYKPEVEVVKVVDGKIVPVEV